MPKPKASWAVVAMVSAAICTLAGIAYGLWSSVKVPWLVTAGLKLVLGLMTGGLVLLVSTACFGGLLIAGAVGLISFGMFLWSLLRGQVNRKSLRLMLLSFVTAFLCCFIQAIFGYKLL